MQLDGAVLFDASLNLGSLARIATVPTQRAQRAPSLPPPANMGSTGRDSCGRGARHLAASRSISRWSCAQVLPLLPVLALVVVRSHVVHAGVSVTSTRGAVEYSRARCTFGDKLVFAHVT